jgi:hypothetical protein
MPLARSVVARRLKGSFQVAVLGEASQDDLDRVLPFLGVAVGDVGEHAALCRLDDEVAIGRVEQCDDRAGGLVHDLLDQLERVLGALAETDERNIGCSSAVTGPTSLTSICGASTSCPMPATMAATSASRS